MQKNEQHLCSFVAKGTFFYMASSLVVKIVGAFYKVPLFNLLSLNGIGLYQMVFPLFAFLITFCGGYATPLITKLIGEGYSKKYILRKSLFIFLPVALVFSVLLFSFSKGIARFQGNEEGALLYKIMAFALIPTTAVFCLRGYFQGLGNFRMTAISQLVEQIIKCVAGISLIYILGGSYIKRASFACFALVISEFIALFYLVLEYFIKEKKDKKWAIKNSGTEKENNFEKCKIENKSLCKSYPLSEKDEINGLVLIREILPLCLLSLIMPLASLFDSFIVINALKSTYGRESTGIYGLYTGAVQTVIMLPVGILHAFSCGCLPVLSREKERFSYRKLINPVLILSLLSSIFIGIFPDFIVKILFSSQGKNGVLLARLLRTSAPIIILLSLLQTANTILLSKSRQGISFIFMLLGVTLKVVLNLILVKNPEINIFGMVISDAGCYFVALMADLLYIYYSNKRKTTENKDENNACRIGNRKRHSFSWWRKGYKNSRQSDLQN